MKTNDKGMPERLPCMANIRAFYIVQKETSVLVCIQS